MALRRQTAALVNPNGWQGTFLSWHHGMFLAAGPKIGPKLEMARPTTRVAGPPLQAGGPLPSERQRALG